MKKTKAKEKRLMPMSLNAKPKYHQMQQGTPEWFAIRKGKMTASHATAIGNCGKGLDSYINEIMAEYYSSGEKEEYTNKHIERGKELEPLARSIYELTTDEKVEEVGFIEYNEYVGCSPDGLTKDGGIEIKCIDDVNFFKIVIDGKIPSDYEWQIQMNLLISGKKWWDFIAYNPNFTKSIKIIRCYPDEQKFELLKKGFEIGIEKIKEITKKYDEN